MSARGARPDQGRLVLITGAVRSGKSRFAERLATELAGDGAVTYIATARVWDDEMAARVRAHQESRPAAWRTVEEPEALVAAVTQARDEDTAVVLVESLDMWVSNRLMALHPVDDADTSALDNTRLAELERALVAEATHLASSPTASHVVLVTVEAGWGVVPPYPLGRAFRDLLGRVNSTLAKRADEVYLMVAGLPIDVKRLAHGG